MHLNNMRVLLINIRVLFYVNQKSKSTDVEIILNRYRYLEIIVGDQI